MENKRKPETLLDAMEYLADNFGDQKTQDFVRMIYELGFEIIKKKVP